MVTLGEFTYAIGDRVSQNAIERIDSGKVFRQEEGAFWEVLEVDGHEALGRRHSALAAPISNTEILIFGGIDSDGVERNDILIFNTEANTLSTVRAQDDTGLRVHSTNFCIRPAGKNKVVALVTDTNKEPVLV